MHSNSELFPTGLANSVEIDNINHDVSQVGRSFAHSCRWRVNLPSAILIMKVARWSSMHVDDVAGESSIYYPHHEGG